MQTQKQLRLPLFLAEEAAGCKKKDTTRVTHNDTTHQFYLICREHRTTDALEFLEQSGYTGDAALFVLTYIQGGLE